MNTITDGGQIRLTGAGWRIVHGPDTPGAERTDFAQVVVGQRLRYALAAQRDSRLPRLVTCELSTSLSSNHLRTFAPSIN